LAPTFKDDPEYLNLTAQALSLEHQKTEALAAINRAIKMELKRAPFFVTQGRIYQRFNDEFNAIESFLQAAQLCPRWAVPVYHLGMTFFLLGNDENDTTYYDRAARHFNAALQLQPNYHKAEFMLGVVDAVKLHLDTAKQHFEQALKMSPQNPFYHLHYGVVLSRMEDGDGALREIRLAEKLDPSNAMANFNLGGLEARLGDYADARQQLEVAVRLDPQLSAACYRLGGVYHHLGLTEMSRAAYEKFRQASVQEREGADPIEAAISSSELNAGGPVPQ
jgi:tetratricopeptide (TPR) repeat protein